MIAPPLFVTPAVQVCRSVNLRRRASGPRRSPRSARHPSPATSPTRTHRFMKSSLRARIWPSICGILAGGGMLAAGSLAVLADSYQPTPAVGDSSSDETAAEDAAETVPPPELSTHMGSRDSSGPNQAGAPRPAAPTGQSSRVVICQPQVPPLCQTMGPEPDCTCQNACGCQYDPICQDACGCSVADTYRAACRPSRLTTARRPGNCCWVATRS
jgi:hypothetical protein